MFPYINFSLFYFLKLVRRFLDSGTGCCKILNPDSKVKTKIKNITKFVELYSGGDFFLYFKYSNIMVLSFCTFTHSIAFPILFPIALFGLINNFVVEKLLLAYYYRQPTLIDN